MRSMRETMWGILAGPRCSGELWNCMRVDLGGRGEEDGSACWIGAMSER